VSAGMVSDPSNGRAIRDGLAFCSDERKHWSDSDISREPEDGSRANCRNVVKF